LVPGGGLKQAGSIFVRKETGKAAGTASFSFLSEKNPLSGSFSRPK
jgi:hypothetical protein